MMIEIKESSQTGEARRKAVAFAHDLRLSETRSGAVAVAATEMASNLVKHAGNGIMLLQRVQENGDAGLRLIAIDKGPGIADVPRALEDGHFTAGSMGTGLGAVRRMSDIFEVYSALGVGTVIRAEFWQDSRHNSHWTFMPVLFPSPCEANRNVETDGDCADFPNRWCLWLWMALGTARSQRKPPEKPRKSWPRPGMSHRLEFCRISTMR